MDFLHFLRRHFWFIFLSTILFGGLGGYYSFTHQSMQAKTTIFLTIANQQTDDSPDQAEIASTFFGETIMGWFRNPVFTDTILTTANIPNASFSASKQERQNMLIDIQSDTESHTKTLANTTLSILIKEVQRYNTASKNDFVVINQGRTTRISTINNVTLPLASTIFGLILAILLVALKEFLRDQVSSVEEAEQILGVKTLDFLNKEWEKNDLTLLSVSIQKAEPIVILAGVNITTDILAVALAHKHSVFGEKMALVDGDMKTRELHETLGLSSRMKNIKGHTDAFVAENEVVSTTIIMQNTLDDNLKFLPAGKGERFLAQVFTNIAQEMKTLIHTQFPENFEVLRLANATLILIVQIGKTKRKDLQRIREVWNGDLKLVIAS